jgi:acyl transferase domain-containing protein/acyl carrier protein
MSSFPPSSIAIVGLSGRFPDAPDVQTFWRNLERGVESLITFSDQELLDAGVPAEMLGNPKYVRKGTPLAKSDFFDADFFGYNPREAEIIDPQQRVFLECAWEALEDAGYPGEPRAATIGVYAGSTTSSYVYTNLLKNPSVLQASGGYQVMIANDKDYLATRVSYKLNLTGPSVTVQTACSTSLVAVQMACSAILSGQCDMALSGGVSIGFPQTSGYLYTEGMIFSPDGHCRPFDAEGRGIRAGFGAGVVVLKRLDKALQDGDHIRAVIRGAAVNNDGGVKMGYTAPSVEGQARAIADALRLAQVEPDSVSYVEAHGTATPVGDPIEITALSRVFQASTDRKQFCAIGSVKGNIGHLDAAAGIAGLIKTVLALENKLIPPSVNFRKPNPGIDFEHSPFFVNASLREWTSGDGPRRAGVSSFGIGGTNAHLVLEEAPQPRERRTNWPSQLLVLSARSAAALEVATTHLGKHLAAYPTLPLEEACYTLQVGRKRFPHRRAVVCSDRESALEQLRSDASGLRTGTSYEEAVSRPMVFLFSGQGSQHIGMARGLYDSQLVFRTLLDECASLLREEIDYDLRDILYASDASAALLTETSIAQPALFAIEYSLARLWMSWGVQPESMMGHSIGEYVAACLAGVFSLVDGLRLVAARGRLMQQMPAGSMLAVRLSAEEVESHLEGKPEISIAAVNAPRMCALSGPSAAIRAIQSSLEARGVDCRPLHTSHAFHSSMMDDVLDRFGECLSQCKLAAPTIPFVSNVTGRWILAEQATDVSYWVGQLRHTVRFADGMRELATNPSRIFLEVGPGQVLTALARECMPEFRPNQILASLPHPQDTKTDPDHILATVGKLWLSGVEIDWEGLHQGESPARTSLPTYPFESRSYWVAPEANGTAAAVLPSVGQEERRAKFDDWFYCPSWRRSLFPTAAVEAGSYGPWLIFADESELSRSVIARLTQSNERVITVRQGEGFSQEREREYAIDPTLAESYRMLINQIAASGSSPRSVLYFWSCDGAAGKGRAGFGNLWFLAQALGEQPRGRPIDLIVVSSGMHAINGNEAVDPEMSLLLGPCKVIPREYPQIVCRSVDVADHSSSTVEGLLLEPGMPHASRAVAYRAGYRWEQSYERARLPAMSAQTVREGGVYLITGGMGGIGLTLAAHLAETARARIGLVSRKPLPDRSEWTHWLETHDADDDTCWKIRELKTIEALGGKVLPLAADVCDAVSMGEAIAEMRGHFGAINGVIHAAGIVEPGLLQLKTQATVDRVLAPKVDGTMVLDSLLQGESLDFLMLCSSINAIGGVAGSIDYTAANCFLDAFAASRFKGGRATVVSVNWDAWREVGMAFNRGRGVDLPARKQREYDEAAISPAEGAKAFRQVLASGLPQVAVTPRDLHRLLEELESEPAALAAENSMPERETENGKQALHPRPGLATAYVAPETEVQSVLAEIWGESLGIRDVGIDDNFFELGGHSLLAIAILSSARQSLGVTLSLRTIFDAPTIRSLSEQLETLLWVTSRPAARGDELEQREEIAL